MGRIVLHVGPEKCGSSSIQSALLNAPDELKLVMHAMMLEPRHVLNLSAPATAPDSTAHFHALIRNARANHPDKTLVLSHEMMFKLVDVLVSLCDIARDYADEVRVIGYIRRQSDFLVSSFGQWLFRSPARISEAADVLRQNGIDPSLFWGVERHLIAAILGGWHIGRQLSGHLYLDWSESIPERVTALAGLDVPVSIGLLPRSGFNIPLISDFLARAGLDPELGRSIDMVTNQSYHPVMIEAVLNAIEAGHAMPGPHEAHEFFNLTVLPDIQKLDKDTRMMTLLKAHIDTVFEQRNASLAKGFDFPPHYFSPAERIDSDAIRREIIRESAVRAAAPEELRNRDRLGRAALAQMAWATFQHGKTRRTQG